MPSFCELAAPITCRSCGREMTMCGVVNFQWGRVPFRGYRCGHSVPLTIRPPVTTRRERQ